jgi:Ras-related protein Rab-7A
MTSLSKSVNLSAINLSIKKTVRNLKMLVLGNARTGKTSLIQDFVNGTFNREYEPTVGVDFASRNVVLTDGNDGGDKKVNLNLVDTAGQERYQGLSVSYYRNVDVCVLVFDVTNRDSFESLEKWKDEFVIQAGLSTSHDDFPFVVLGNKIDAADRRVVTNKEAQEWCRKQQHAFYYMEVSAKNSHESEDDAQKVDRVFIEIAEKALAYSIEKALSEGDQHRLLSSRTLHRSDEYNVDEPSKIRLLLNKCCNLM